jgi:hypothetical protein
LEHLLNNLDTVGGRLSSLANSITYLQEEAAFYKEIIDIGSRRRKMVLKEWCIDDSKARSQHHWKNVIPRAVKWLNPYVCRLKDCESDCKKKHELTYKKIAQILSILYPEIWTGEINSIANNIKQRDYTAPDVPPFPAVR